MVCRVRVPPDKEYVVRNLSELNALFEKDAIINPYWMIKCDGNTRDDAEIMGYMLDMVPDAVAITKDGWMLPLEAIEDAVNPE